MDQAFDPRSLDAVLHAIGADHDDSFENADIDPLEWDHLGLRREGAFRLSRPAEGAGIPQARNTVPPRRASSIKSPTPITDDGILLVGGPYGGMHVHDSIDANGVYVISGAKGEFAYRLYQRTHRCAIAVPFDATAVQIRDALFKQAGQHSQPFKPVSNRKRNRCMPVAARSNRPA